MRRRQLLLGAGCGWLTLIVAVVAGVWYIFGGLETVTDANYRRITPGMTLAEVTAILGEPARTLRPESGGDRCLRWENNHTPFRVTMVYVTVEFRDDVVIDKKVARIDP
jgi:hypothetical protein